MNRIARFCVSYNVKSGATKPCSLQEFERIVDDARLCSTLVRLEQLAAEGDKEAYRALKESLPVFCFHAMRYDGDRRLVKGAVRSGLVMLDVDHIDDPAALYRTFVDKGGLDRFATALVYRTPSGQGLRFVVERADGTSIVEEQRRLATFIGTAHDTSTCDDARASFAVSRDRIYYLDERLLWYPDDDTPENRQRLETANQQRYPSSDSRTAPAAAPSATASAAPADAPIAATYDASLMFGGLRYADIVQRYFTKKLGHMPMEGERNVQLLSAARDLWAVTEGSETKLKQVLPTLGLSDAELDTIVRNAAAYRRANPVAKIPYVLWSVIKELEEENHIAASAIGEEFDEGVGDSVPDEVIAAETAIPALPPVIRELTAIAPAGFKIPTIMACLPILGTALTRLRACYIDGQMTFPGFIVVISAPQASGKSFAGRLVDILLRYVKEHDREQRAIEREYERQMRLNKNAKKQIDDPRVVIQCVPATISIARILKRFDQSYDLGLFSFSPEQDTVTATNNRGGWSQKSDLYRIAFDGGEYGQEYMSENSYSAMVNVKYNLLTTGTPKSVTRFYSDAEDGLVSRCIFGQLANQQYCALPVWGKLTKAQQRLIDDKMREAFALSYDEMGVVQPEHEMRMPWLCGEMNLWLERKRREAAKGANVAMDTFRRRSAVIGFRAGMMAYWLWGENTRHRSEVCAFALFVAELTLSGQMDRFAEQLEKDSATVAAKPSRPHTSAFAELFDALPSTFTAADVAEAAARRNLKTLPRKLTYIWRTAGLIDSDGKVFRKTSS